jgi:hypothetical protein
VPDIAREEAPFAAQQKIIFPKNNNIFQLQLQLSLAKIGILPRILKYELHSDAGRALA